MNTLQQARAIPGGLPPGPHGLPRELVRAHQRDRIFDALAKVVAEQGYAELTVRKVIGAAGISSTTFYELFDHKQQVVWAAYDAIFARLLERIESACATQADWPAKVEAAIAAAIGFAIAEPESCRLLGIDGLDGSAGSRGCVRAQERLAALLAPGRRHSPGERLPPLTELALVGSIWSIVASCLSEGDVARLAQLEGEIIELGLSPYAGAGA
jgi:TetR/AcrR family transcriptional regulator